MVGRFARFGGVKYVSLLGFYFAAEIVYEIIVVVLKFSTLGPRLAFVLGLVKHQGVLTLLDVELLGA